jgi:hypothetical protein
MTLNTMTMQNNFNKQREKSVNKELVKWLDKRIYEVSEIKDGYYKQMKDKIKHEVQRKKMHSTIL